MVTHWKHITKYEYEQLFFPCMVLLYWKGKLYGQALIQVTVTVWFKYGLSSFWKQLEIRLIYQYWCGNQNDYSIH